MYAQFLIHISIAKSAYNNREQDIGLHIAISVIIFTIQLEVLKHADKKIIHLFFSDLKLTVFDSIQR